MVAHSSTELYHSGMQRGAFGWRVALFDGDDVRGALVETMGK